ncbi:transposase [Streptacidiphilus melanogenes]
MCEKHPRRRILDAIFYLVRTGCSWQQWTKDLAPWPTGVLVLLVVA